LEINAPTHYRRPDTTFLEFVPKSLPPQATHLFNLPLERQFDEHFRNERKSI
jgi:hypothetical protein